jgi:hypothetical protein
MNARLHANAAREEERVTLLKVCAEPARRRNILRVVTCLPVTAYSTLGSVALPTAPLWSPA